MYIDAFYLSASSFWVRGNWASAYRTGLRVLVRQAQNGDPYGTVNSAVYNDAYQRTEVTVTLDSGDPVRASIYRVELGDGWSDPITQEGNIGNHKHDGPWSGGFMDASLMTEGLLANLAYLPLLAEYPNNSILGVNSDHTDFEPKELVGTTNQITIVDTVGIKTFSLPQNIHSGASPEFYGLKLTNLTGLLEADADGDLVAHEGEVGELPYHNGTSMAFLGSPEHTPIKPSVLQFYSNAPIWALPPYFQRRGVWYTGTTFYIGDITKSHSRSFVCLTAHDSSEADEPGVGPYWADYWEPLCPDDMMVWRGSWDEVAYFQGDVVTVSSILYVAKLFHTGSSADEPGVGPYWADYWDQMN